VLHTLGGSVKLSSNKQKHFDMFIHVLIYINRDHKVGQDGEEKMIFRKSSGWHICRMSIF